MLYNDCVYIAMVACHGGVFFAVFSVYIYNKIDRNIGMEILCYGVNLVKTWIFNTQMTSKVQSKWFRQPAPAG